MGSFLSDRARHIRPIVVVFVLTALLVSGLLPAPTPDAIAQTTTSPDEASTDDLPTTRKELTELRTRNAKFYQEPDGTRTAEIYAEPVHLETDSGQWQEIDTSLVASDRPGYAYENRRGAFAVEFSAMAKESGMVRVQSEGAVLSFGVAGADRASRAVVTANRLTYPGVLPGVDLALEVTPEGLKEFVVLTKRPDKPLSVRFPFSLQGVIPKKQTDGRISFLRGDGKSAFALPRGWMFDSSGSEQTEPAVSDAVNFDLDLKSSKPAIIVTPDSWWLADPARVYPVMVDPTLETINPIPDCYITNGSADDTTHCGSDVVHVGWDGSKKRRGLLKFPIEQLPDDAIVNDADLRLYLNGSTAIRSAPIEVHRLTSSWGEGATWKRRTWDNQNLWGIQGGDFTNFVWASRDISGASLGYKAWDISTLVREWHKPDGAPDYGMLLKQDTEAVNNLLTFASYQGVQSRWPKLVVSYSGVELDVNQWAPNYLTGVTNYNVTANATGLDADGDPQGPCHGNFDCMWTLEARYSDGTYAPLPWELDSGILEAGTDSFSKNFTGALSDEVTDLRMTVDSIGDYFGYNGLYDSGWIHVSDPYPDGNVSLSIGTWSRDASTDHVEYDLTVAGGGAGQFGGPCEENKCRWAVEVRFEDGGTSELGAQDLVRGTWAFTKNLNGATTFPQKVTDLRGLLQSKCVFLAGHYCSHRHETYTTGWIPVSDYVYKNQDLFAAGVALGPILTRNPTFFCMRFLLEAGTHHLGGTVTDQYLACEGIVVGAGIYEVVQAILDAPGPATIPDFVPDPFPAPDPSGIPEVREDWEDETGCEQDIPQSSIDDDELEAKIEARHGYASLEEDASKWGIDVPWKLLVRPHALNYKATEQTVDHPGRCKRVIRYIASVGYEWVFASHEYRITDEYSVITDKETGNLVTTFPGRPGSEQT